MASELVAAPLKKADEVELARPLSALLRAAASTSDQPDNFKAVAAQMAALRQSAIWRPLDRTESALEPLFSYHDQLVSLEEKIPAQDIQIPFKWKDAFDRGSIFGGRMSLTISSLGFEKVCILYNIAALQSIVASSKQLDDDDSLKSAAKLFQQSAGVFKYLKENVMVIVHQDTTPDLQHDTLSALHNLMLAQAQEIIVLKAIKDNMKHPYIPSLANQCKELYSITLKILQREVLKPLIDKDWVAIVTAKVSAYEGVAFYYYSQYLKSKMSVGSQISALQYSVELFKTAQTARGKPGAYQDNLSRSQRDLAEVMKDNDLIYHDIIPDVQKLEPLGKIALANPIDVPKRYRANHEDLFENLMPVPVHQALAAYDVRKNEIVNTEINKLRESTQLLNSTLTSLNLPASIEKTSGTDLPPSILEKADNIKESGGVNGLLALMRDLPELLQRNTDILNEAERMLREESDADKQLRSQFGAKWTRTPSEELTKMFVANVAKYMQIIENAKKADSVVKEKYETHKEGMELLSKSIGELQANVPSSSGGGFKESAIVMKLRKLMEDVETIKAERDVIESELKSATQDMKSKFLEALSQDGAISEPVVSVSALGEAYGPLQKQVTNSLERQDNLIKDIQAANSIFVSESGGGGNGRETKLCQLAASHDAYCDLLSNLKEGSKFYNDLTQLLVIFQNKISDYCFARKTEKEELMKDLTQQSSRVVPGNPTPNVPQHHNITPEEVRNTTPQPSTVPQGASNLPYPQPGQGNMPVPYGAPNAAPYPAYQPPMPQGYNPYGMPYPQSSGYSGFPQAPYMPHPMQYPQSGPMGAPYNPGAPQYPQYPGAPQYPPGSQQYPQYPPQGPPPQW